MDAVDSVYFRRSHWPIPRKTSDAFHNKRQRSTSTETHTMLNVSGGFTMKLTSESGFNNYTKKKKTYLFKYLSAIFALIYSSSFIRCITFSLINIFWVCVWCVKCEHNAMIKWQRQFFFYFRQVDFFARWQMKISCFSLQQNTADERCEAWSVFNHQLIVVHICIALAPPNAANAWSFGIKCLSAEFKNVNAFIIAFVSFREEWQWANIAIYITWTENHKCRRKWNRIESQMTF